MGGLPQTIAVNLLIFHLCSPSATVTMADDQRQHSLFMSGEVSCA